jgi:hypothetical protein
MLTEFQLSNFKAFAGPENIPIRPITLIFGPNSSGKSSLFQSLLLLKQTLEESEAPETTLLFKGKQVDLGNYREIVHRHDLNNDISVKASFSKPAQLLESFPFHVSDEGLANSYIDEDLARYKKITLGIVMTCDAFTLDVHVKQISNYFDNDISPSATYIRFQKDNKLYRSELIKGCGNIFDDDALESLKHYFSELGIKNFLPDFDYLIYSPISGYDDYLYSKEFLLSMAMASMFKQFLSEIYYLGPQRELPKRTYVLSGTKTTYVGKSGEFVPDLLTIDNEILLKVNSWFGKLAIPYILKVARLSDPDTDILDLFSLRLLDNLTGVHVGISDVGFGISQVLPVIVQSTISIGKTLLIEQPEYHLHPRLQAELGDMFIEAALGERRNTFLIETHSEHLILRILRRIRETAEGTLPEDLTPIKPEDVAVLYVQPGDNGSRIINIPVNEEGYFDRPWPVGFFAERARELL